LGKPPGYVVEPVHYPEPPVPAAPYLGVQRVQPLLPEAAVPLQPRFHLEQRIRVQGVQAASAVHAHGREAVLTQHLQVLGDRRLADPELRPHRRRQLPRGRLPVGEQFQQPAPDRVAEDVERVHADR